MCKIHLYLGDKIFSFANCDADGIKLYQTEASSGSELLFIKDNFGEAGAACIAELLNDLFYSIHATPSFVPSSVLPVVEQSLAGGCRSEIPLPDFIWE